MDASIMVLTTIFPDADESLVQSVLDAHDGDLIMAQGYLERYFEANKAAASVLQPRDVSLTEASMIQSAKLNALSGQFNGMEVSVLRSVLEAFDGDIDQARVYLERNGHSMQYRKTAQSGDGADTPCLNSSQAIQTDQPAGALPVDVPLTKRNLTAVQAPQHGTPHSSAPIRPPRPLPQPPLRRPEPQISEVTCLPKSPRSITDRMDAGSVHRIWCDPPPISSSPVSQALPREDDAFCAEESASAPKPAFSPSRIDAWDSPAW
nr:hypothetical protein HK105_006050 [Polyrhizophydium stewartii]